MRIFIDRDAAKIVFNVLIMCGLDRNILLFPRGTKPMEVRCLSLFLNVPDAEAQPLNWSRKASFKLTVLNQKQPARSVSKGASLLQYVCSCVSMRVTSPAWRANVMKAAIVEDSGRTIKEVAVSASFFDIGASLPNMHCICQVP